MKLSYTYWQNNGFYIGHLNEYPEYDTQGKSLAELETMLKSLYDDILELASQFLDIMKSTNI